MEIGGRRLLDIQEARIAERERELNGKLDIEAGSRNADSTVGKHKDPTAALEV